MTSTEHGGAVANGSETEATLATSGLGYDYNGRPALRGVDLKVGPGEVVGVIGPNGSGKTTLLKVLSGVLGEYEGSARVGGEEIRGIPRAELARRLAVVPQESTFGFSFTALEIVLMGRHPHMTGLEFESERDLELAREALDRCGALELAERRIHELSSGERQRIVFAKALAQQPSILLLDEPASFLDIRHQVEIFDVVRSLADERQCSVLTVLHDLNHAAEYCDRIYLLSSGRVEADGPTARVLTYANLTRVFDTEVYVDLNALTGKLLVVPLPGKVQRRLRGR